MEWVDLNALVTDALYLARHNPKVADADIEVQEFYEKLPKAYISRDKVNQALLNIILNAFQATPSGGKVTIHTHFSKSSPLPIQVKVMNTGSNISEDKLKRVFEPFFTTKESGTGLGLSISYQIITHHGGDIQVASEADGVAFTIRLPLQEKEKDQASE
jgi:signal transduction histidine kinase